MPERGMESRTDRAILTSSWDDGHPLDLRVADLLARTGMQGTFYVPLANAEGPLLTPAELRELHCSFEVGAHTRSHVRLPGLSDASLRDEIVAAKAELEERLGAAVTSFCYPGGKFSRRARTVIRTAGFAVARTTVSFRFDGVVDALALPVTLQAFPHSPWIHVRHAVQDGNVRGVVHYLPRARWGRDWVRLAIFELERALETATWWHLWGHSWEIEALGAWQDLENVMREAGASGARMVDNTTLGTHLGASG